MNTIKDCFSLQQCMKYNLKYALEKCRHALDRVHSKYMGIRETLNQIVVYMLYSETIYIKPLQKEIIANFVSPLLTNIAK